MRKFCVPSQIREPPGISSRQPRHAIIDTMLSGVLAAAFYASTYASPAVPPGCPKSAAEWEQWRTRIIASIRTPDELADGRLKLLEQCRPAAEIQACTANLRSAAEGSQLHPKQSTHGR